MKRYEVLIGGLPHTFELSDADARARGLDPHEDAVTAHRSAPPAAKAARPANKARATQNK